MKEYNLWKKIFEENDEEKLELLIKIAVENEDTALLILDKIIELKSSSTKVVKLTVNIDKNFENFPSEQLVSKISSDIQEQIKNSL